jgi:hypothetical protein
MSDIVENYAFEEFPRQALPELISRRELLSAILTKMRAESHKNRGKRVLSLAKLGEAPDEKLLQIIPVIVKNSGISVKEGFVIGQPSRSDRSYKLFPLRSPALIAFNMINGSNTLEQISMQLTKETGWEQSRSLAYVRGLFLALVVAGLSQPKDG